MNSETKISIIIYTIVILYFLELIVLAFRLLRILYVKFFKSDLEVEDVWEDSSDLKKTIFGFLFGPFIVVFSFCFLFAPLIGICYSISSSRTDWFPLILSLILMPASLYGLYFTYHVILNIRYDYKFHNKDNIIWKFIISGMHIEEIYSVTGIYYRYINTSFVSKDLTDYYIRKTNENIGLKCLYKSQIMKLDDVTHIVKHVYYGGKSENEAEIKNDIHLLVSYISKIYGEPISIPYRFEKDGSFSGTYYWKKKKFPWGAKKATLSMEVYKKPETMFGFILNSYKNVYNYSVTFDDK